MPRYWFPKAYADFAQRLRVPIGFLLVAAFACFSRPTSQSFAAGIPVAAAGLLLRAWAAGHLEKNQRLATSGPYGWTRNPLYLGTALVAAGLVVASRRVELAVLFTAAFVLVYLPAIELEEQHLRTLFPEYAGYAERVPKLIPRPPPAGGGPRFRFTLYCRNREYQALGGFLAGALLLAWRAWR